jgi:hypothetical protein
MTTSTMATGIQEAVLVQMEEYRAVSFHDVEYSVHSLFSRKTKKILKGVRYICRTILFGLNFISYPISKPDLSTAVVTILNLQAMFLILLH